MGILIYYMGVTNNKKTYLYLARRDKRGIKMLSAFPGGKDKMPATRIKDITSLGLPTGLTERLAAVIHEERMMWEPFLECADGYGDLVAALQKRGYSQIPKHFEPLDPVVGTQDKNKEIKFPEPHIKPIEKKKSMLRKAT